MKNNFQFLDLVVRYVLIFLAGLNGLFLFYFIFSPLTFKLSALFFSFFGSVKTFYALNLILFNQTAIELIGACVAGSAYYLLFILAISTRNVLFKKRLLILLFTFSLLLLFNILRIVIMGLIAGSKFFDEVHMLFWYFISIFFVVCIWFLAVKIFKIKEIPVYSDVKFLLARIK